MVKSNITKFVDSLKSDFIKSIITLMSGTVIAHLITFGFSPIITRLYSPSQLGVLTAFISVLSIFSVISSGRYEIAILLPKKLIDSINIVFLVIIISLSLSGIVIIILYFYQNQILKIINKEILKPYIFLIPIGGVLVAAYIALYYFHNRKKSYKVIAASKIGQSITYISFAITFAFILKSAAGLIIGYLAGYLMQIIIFTANIYHTKKKIFRLLTIKKVRENAVKYRNYPSYLLLSGVIETTSVQIPVLFMTKFYTMQDVGWFGLAQQIVTAPMILIGKAMADVFKQKASEKYIKEGSARGLLVKTSKNLFIISIIPFGVLYLIAPQMFSILFGNNWQMSGEYARLMVPMYFLSFVVGPISSMIFISGKTYYDLVLQLYLIIFTTSAFAFGYYYFKDIKISILLYTLVYAIKYMGEFLVSYRLSKK